MCLSNPVNSEKAIRKIFGKSDRVFVWKFLTKNLTKTGFRIVTPYRYDVVKIDENRFYFSDRKGVKVSAKERKLGVNLGIHVFLENPKGGQNHVFYVKCVGYKQDFVARSNKHVLNTQQGVFTKIQFPSKTVMEVELPVYKNIKEEKEINNGY